MIAQNNLNLSTTEKSWTRWKYIFRRYWTLCKVSFQARMEYRWNTLLWMTISIVPILVGMYIWSSIFGSKNSPAYVRYIVSYYLVAGYIGFRIADFNWEFLFNVREGRLATSLMRPMSFPATIFWSEAGGRTWSTILTTPFFVVIAFLLGNNFEMPNNIWPWLLTLVAFLISFVMNFFLTASLGLITVWQNQPEPFFYLYWGLTRTLGGMVVPLALLPLGLGNWFQWLPFAYIYSLPTRIFLGLPTDQLLQGFAVQIFWLIVTGLFFNWLWRKAIRRYEVFEG